MTYEERGGFMSRGGSVYIFEIRRLYTVSLSRILNINTNLLENRIVTHHAEVGVEQHLGMFSCGDPESELTQYVFIRLSCE